MVGGGGKGYCTLPLSTLLLGPQPLSCSLLSLDPRISVLFQEIKLGKQLRIIYMIWKEKYFEIALKRLFLHFYER